MHTITDTWQNDEAGLSDPDNFVAKRFFHPKTAHIYVVKNYSLDAERALWLLHYKREDRSGLTFTHTISDFTREGRFIQIKE